MSIFLEAQQFIDARGRSSYKHTISVTGQIHSKWLIKTSKDHQETVKFERFSGPINCCTCTNCHYCEQIRSMGFLLP